MHRLSVLGARAPSSPESVKNQRSEIPDFVQDIEALNSPPFPPKVEESYSILPYSQTEFIF